MFRNEDETQQDEDALPKTPAAAASSGDNEEAGSTEASGAGEEE